MGDLTDDQVYLSDRVGPVHPIIVTALNVRYGVLAVTEALRYMRGFGRDIFHPRGYLVAILRATI